ncbi:unnamed protein product [Soboliphyme baturini]|uniref:Peptidase S1 domain-containing protein n=1 Tax=Soboliphyme baturini TaxID=241478 RepID=A0A183IX92_9BILA|nr:unnamed protein product [Soboliphyme baturini]
MLTQQAYIAVAGRQHRNCEPICTPAATNHVAQILPHSVESGHLTAYVSFAYAVVKDCVPCHRQCHKKDLSPSQRILSGMDTLPNSQPSVVRISANGSHITGFLICVDGFEEKTLLLTAQRGLFNSDNVLLDPSLIQVTMGAVDFRFNFETGRMTHILSKYVVYAKFFHRNPAYDIALLEIYPRVRWSPKIRPLCLPETPVQTMQHCYMYGYGSTMRIDSRPSSTLKYATLAILNQSVCLRHFQYNSRRLICTSSIDAHRTPTNGDFGGPVLCAESDGGYFWYAPRGIITEQINTRGCLHIHTDVTAFKNWISVAAGQLNSLPPNSRSKLGLNPFSFQLLN